MRSYAEQRKGNPGARQSLGHMAWTPCIPHAPMCGAPPAPAAYQAFAQLSLHGKDVVSCSNGLFNSHAFPHTAEWVFFAGSQLCIVG
eukprot:350375-Chlamydomonas_euryale.AAC.3